MAASDRKDPDKIGESQASKQEAKDVVMGSKKFGNAAEALMSFIEKTDGPLMLAGHVLIRFDIQSKRCFDLLSMTEWDWKPDGYNYPMITLNLGHHQFIQFDTSHKAFLCSWHPTNKKDVPFTIKNEKPLNLPNYAGDEIAKSYRFSNTYEAFSNVIVRVFPDNKHLAILTMHPKYQLLKSAENHLHIFDITKNEVIIDINLKDFLGFEVKGKNLLILKDNAVAVQFGTFLGNKNQLYLKMLSFDFEKRSVMAQTTTLERAVTKELRYSSELFLCPNNNVGSWVQTRFDAPHEVQFYPIPGELFSPQKELIPLEPIKEQGRVVIHYYQPLCLLPTGQNIVMQRQTQQKNLYAYDAKLNNYSSKSFPLDCEMRVCLDYGVFILKKGGASSLEFFGNLSWISPAYKSLEADAKAQPRHGLIDQLFGIYANTEMKLEDRNAKAYTLVQEMAALTLDFNVFDEENSTLLYKAVSYNYLPTVKLLLENKADPNLSYKNKVDTVLYCAVDRGNVEIVDLLIQHRANVNLTSGHETALAKACDKLNDNAHNYITIIKKLCEAKADTNLGMPLISVVSKNDEVTKLLLQHKAQVNVKDFFSHSPFTNAKKLTTITLLLEHCTTPILCPGNLVFNLLHFNSNDPQLLHAVRLFLKIDKSYDLEKFYNEQKLRQFLMPAAYTKFVDPGAVTPDDLKKIYPDDKLVFSDYEKNFHIQPAENDEAKQLREHKEAELQIKQTNFQNQFYKLVNKLQIWARENNLSQAALEGLNVLSHNMFNEQVTGTQPVDFFNATKRNLEEIYVRLTHQHLPIDFRKNIFEELCTTLAVCGVGMGGKIASALTYLSNPQTVNGWLALARTSIIKTLAAKYKSKYRGELKMHAGLEVHVDIGMLQRASENNWAPSEETKFQDDFLTQVGLNPKNEASRQYLKQFDDDFLAQYTPTFIIQTIYDNFRTLCEEKVPAACSDKDAKQEKWLSMVPLIDKTAPGSLMIGDLEEAVQAAELKGLPVDFYESRNNDTEIKCNFDSFKRRVIKWCYDQHLFQEHVWITKALDRENTVVTFGHDDRFFWIESKDRFFHIENSTIAEPVWQKYLESLRPEEQANFVKKIDIKKFASDAEQLGLLVSKLKDQKESERLIQRIGKDYFKTSQDMDLFMAAFPGDRNPIMQTFLQPYAPSVSSLGLFAKESKQQEVKEEYQLSFEEINYLKKQPDLFTFLETKSHKIKLACLKAPELAAQFTGPCLWRLGSQNKEFAFCIMNDTNLLNKLGIGHLKSFGRLYEETAMFLLENEEMRSKFESYNIVDIAKMHTKAAKFVMDNKNLFAQCSEKDFKFLADEISLVSKSSLSPDEIKQYINMNPIVISNLIALSPQKIRLVINTPEVLEALPPYILSGFIISSNLLLAISIIKKNKLDKHSLCNLLLTENVELIKTILEDPALVMKLESDLFNLATLRPDPVGKFILSHPSSFASYLNADQLKKIEEAVMKCEQVLASALKPQPAPGV